VGGEGEGLLPHSVAMIREELILTQLNKVRIIVLHRYGDWLNDGCTIGIEDLISAGYEVLIAASEQFSSDKGLSFENYCEIRIRGAVKDELRRFDYLTRAIRQNTRRLEKAALKIQGDTSRAATLEEAADVAGLGPVARENAYWGMSFTLCGLYAPIRLSSEGELFKEEFASDILLGPAEDDPAMQAERLEAKEIVHQEVNKLPEREREIVQAHDLGGITMLKVAESLGISETRVSQIHSRAFRRLRKALRRRLC